MSGVIIMRGPHALCVLCRICGSLFVRTPKDAKNGAYMCRPCSRPRELEMDRAKGVRSHAEASAAQVVHREEAARRFWTRVAKTETCWNWTAGLAGQNGYGVVRFERKTMPAHRFSWEMAHGPIPAGKEVCHHCDNPICVNPAHLFVGTHAENMADAAKKNRLAFAERHFRSKLTTAHVHEIYAARQRGVPVKELMQQYGVSDATISNIGLGHRKILGGRSR